MWLNEQKSKATPERGEKIQTLIDNLNFTKASVEQFYGGEEFIVIPVTTSFQSLNNSDKNPFNYLLLIQNKNGEIRKGNIVQVIADNKQAGMVVPAKAFVKLFYVESPGFDGEFVFLSVADEMQWSVGYKNGHRNKFSIIERKPKEATTGGVAVEMSCTDWFLVTSYYENGVLISQTWTYLFTSCYDECQATRTVQGKNVMVECGGGGGTGGNGEENPLLDRHLHWDVYRENMSGTPIVVRGHIYVYGRKVASEPQGGHFTHSYDQGSYTQNFSTYGINWTGVYTQASHGPQNAYHLVQGNIDYGPNGPAAQYVNNTKTFMFIEVFP